MDLNTPEATVSKTTEQETTEQKTTEFSVEFLEYLKGKIPETPVSLLRHYTKIILRERIEKNRGFNS